MEDYVFQRESSNINVTAPFPPKVTNMKCVSNNFPFVFTVRVLNIFVCV